VIDRRAVLAGLSAVSLLDIGAARAEPAAFQGVRRIAPDLDRIVSSDAAIEVLGSGYRWAEGPVWWAAERCLLFGDPANNVVHRWSRSAGVSTFLSPSGHPAPVPASITEPGLNGLAFDASGKLVAANSGSRAIVRIDPATRRRTTLADRYEGKRFNSPNDLCVSRTGTIYFSDPTYGLAGGDDSPLRELAWCGLYALLPNGDVVLLDRSHRRPNGLALSPDERTLYLALSDDKQPQVLAYALDKDGRPTDRRMFRDMQPEFDAKLPGLPDGIKVAPSGDVFATGPGGVHVCSADGRLLGIIATGKPISNCAFGADGRLYMTSFNILAAVPLANG
jgi:gluconolactonase